MTLSFSLSFSLSCSWVLLSPCILFPSPDLESRYWLDVTRSRSAVSLPRSELPQSWSAVSLSWFRSLGRHFNIQGLLLLSLGFIFPSLGGYDLSHLVVRGIVFFVGAEERVINKNEKYSINLDEEVIGQPEVNEIYPMNYVNKNNEMRMFIIPYFISLFRISA